MEAGFKEREQASAISANSTTDVAAGGKYSCVCFVIYIFSFIQGTGFRFFRRLNMGHLPSGEWKVKINGLSSCLFSV